MMRKVSATERAQLRSDAARNLLLASEKIDLVARYTSVNDRVTVGRSSLAKLDCLRVAKAVQNKQLEMLGPRRFRVNVLGNKE